ncbi:MAG: sulfurtransferase TusA family protein [Myxococcota bacterium]|nr:sulfurtransferase TusA family protein [Myxococcota bacterium]
MQVHKINALGMKCPRPIIELAKLRRKIEPGHVVEIEADDLAFESDVRAWCETTGNVLRDLRRSDDKVTAEIEISEQK